MYSKKLHMRVLRARTSWETSLTILAFSLGDNVVNHFARRCRGDVVSNVVADGTRVQGMRSYHFALTGEKNEVSAPSFSYFARMHQQTG